MEMIRKSVEWAIRNEIPSNEDDLITGIISLSQEELAVEMDARDHITRID